MTPEQELLAVKAAVLYYEDSKTQDEIGNMLALSRWKVGRLLSEARRQGFVRIQVAHPRARRIDLERRVQQKFGLKNVVVAPSLGEEDSEPLRARVAQAAAEYLVALRPIPRTLGISWGRTLHDLAKQLPRDWARGVQVVQVNGGVSLNKRASSASNTATTIAQKASSDAVLLPSPAILELAETKRRIEQDRSVAGVLTVARSAQVHLFSAGLTEGTSVLVDSGYLTPEDMAELVAKGSVGDVLGRFVDADGNVVDPALDERTIGLTTEELRKLPHAVAVVSGLSKRHITRVIVSAGLCSVLVTDEGIANHLLEEE